MAIYDKDGTELASAFEAHGVELNDAFDCDGANVFIKDRTIKVMTYNVGTWYDGKHDNVPAAQDAEYYALQKGMILANDPDIICMEEYCKQFSKAGRTAYSLLSECGYPYIVETKGDSPTASPADGRCIASKYPITNYTVRNFSDGSSLYYDTCTITVKGIPINVMVTHLHWSDIAKRTSEMQTIMSLLSGYNRFILCGDFNTADNYDTSGADYIAVVKPLIDAGYNVANGGSFGFFETYSNEPDDAWVGDLDNIVTSPNIVMLSVYVDETKLTDGLDERVDHLPLVATLEI